MSRNAVTQGTQDRSFAGLMDRLTGYSGNDASDAASDFGATFRRNSKPDAVPSVTSRTDTSLTGSPASAAYALSQSRKSLRPVLPATAPKPGKKVAPAEATALSYDQALRIHGAHRIAPTAAPKAPRPAREERDDPGAARPAGADAAANGRKVAVERKAVPKAPAIGLKSAQAKPAATRGGIRAAPASSAAPIKQKASPIQAGAAARPAAQPFVAEKGSPSASAAAPAVSASRASAGVGKRRMPAQGPPGTLGKGHAMSAAPVSQGRSEGKSQARSGAKGHSPHSRSDESSALPLNPKNTSIQEPTRRMSRGKMDFVQPPVEIMAAEPPQNGLELLSDLSQVDQRRTIVSVRLTEDELACLRDRAEESGISVSAYIRSCVVDADRLRAQVKRALAEMRSLQTPAGPETMTALTASSRRRDGTDAWGANIWFKLVVRPLAILIRPLFPARRSA